MNSDFLFLNFDGLDDWQAKSLHDLINPSRRGQEIEFPWNNELSQNVGLTDQLSRKMVEDSSVPSKGSESSLNVYAPEFQSIGLRNNSQKPAFHNGQKPPTPHYYGAAPVQPLHFPNCLPPSATNQGARMLNGDNSTFVPSTFKLNPTVSSFVPSNCVSASQFVPSNCISASSPLIDGEYLAKTAEDRNCVISSADSPKEPAKSLRTNLQRCDGPVLQSIAHVSVIATKSGPDLEEHSTKLISEHCIRPVSTVHRPGLEQSTTPTAGHPSVKPISVECSVKPVSVKHSTKTVEHRHVSNTEHSSRPVSGQHSEFVSDELVRPGLGDHSKSGRQLVKSEIVAPIKVAQNVTKAISGPVLNGSGAPIESVQNVPKAVSGVVQNVSAASIGTVQNVSGTPIGLVQNVPGSPVGMVQKVCSSPISESSSPVDDNAKSNGIAQAGGPRSWAQIVSKGQKTAAPPTSQPEESSLVCKEGELKEEPEEEWSVEDDKMALQLGEHLHGVGLNYEPVYFQPRGLINRRNWCYVNATLQALLGCSPFYTLLRNLPVGPTMDRGKSSTPVIDSMVRVTYEFLQLKGVSEDVSLGSPFQPDFIYDMLRDLKSDCLKGQQEDAEEFLSFILNRMHEEMVKLIKHYERKNHLLLHTASAEAAEEEEGGASEGEEEWHVIGSKHKGMITRKVTEHRTPISDLLGGQMKAFVTISGSKTSASIQPFFTLQLDIQSDSVNSVADALREMTLKELIQDYTCAKTKQKVDAFNHIALQKVPPILILHLKRFVYSKSGCKKVMKKTEYPMQLELNKEIFSPDVKKNQQQRKYKLFAVLYHDGEEAVKGHYICDVFNPCCAQWMRFDDRAVTPVTQEQVMSHTPPRVPYLLFYQQGTTAT